MKSNSIGTKLIVNGKTVGGLTSINGVEINADTIDVSDLGNTTGYREKLPGWKDAGEVTASGFLDSSDITAENGGQAQLKALLASGDVVDCEIRFPTKIGMSWTFQAGVTRLSTSAEIDNAITFETTLAVSGEPTLAATVTETEPATVTETEPGTGATVTETGTGGEG